MLFDKASRIALEDQSQTLQGQPRGMHGETTAIIDEQGRQMSGGNHRDVLGGFFGTVRDQSVAPGQRVARGTEITLTVV